LAKEKVKKPFYKRIWVWVVAIVIIIAIASGGEEGTETDTANESADNDTETETTEASATAEEPEESESEEEAEDSEAESEEASDDTEEVETAKVGEPAEVADVTFTVNSVEETSEINSGNEFIDNVTTNGKFVILDVTVENGKNEAITIDSNYFKIITGEGTEYEPHSSGDVMMALGDEATDFFLEQINPNLDKTGKVVFEVSDDVELSESVLHAQTGFFGTESIEISLSE
jgi:hypothetical protein